MRVTGLALRGIRRSGTGSERNENNRLVLCGIIYLVLRGIGITGLVLSGITRLVLGGIRITGWF